MSHPLPIRLPGLLLLALLVLGAGLGLRDPSPPDEPRFVLAARHMVESGQWVIPHRGSELYAHKPATFMWLQAAAYLLVHDWRVAFLLPSLLAALGTLWLTHDLTRRLYGRRAAIWAALGLLVVLQFGLQAKRAQIDMVLVFLTTLSMWGLLRHLLRGPDWPALWLGGFAAGLGTVTKGVGFLPLLALIPAIWTMRDGWHGGAGSRPSGARWWGLPLAFVLGTAVWLAPMLTVVLTSDDPALHAYAREILLRQTGERYANAWHHIQPPWYYLQVIFTLWLPGALLLPWLLPAWWRRLRRRDARLLVLLGWAVLVLAFFSASPGKREVYIFPALPLLCVAAAPLLPGLMRRRGVRLTLAGYALLLSLTALALGASGLLADPRWAQRLAEERALDAEALRMLLLWLLALGVGGLVLLGWSRLRRTGTALVLFTALLWVVYGLGLAPALDASSSARALMQRVGERIGPEAELGLLAWREQHLLQADRPARDFGFERPWEDQWHDAARWLGEQPQRRWLFVLDEALGDCVDRQRAEFIGRSNRRDWWLVPGDAVVPDCRPGFAPRPQGDASRD
ncbi:ArnT family glycosyltransferase [Rehaibacterium terrae]|jgi:4-amino-4-deoxy-L-arabinose transferase-like glycosyltransferase|uniref:4-amino-4-deoxy-L-arabinose transferase-like glycosyltransferase n=1 Tax=Rehaibacterium terrae TaxID=1341696 RepID=A0A7W8DEW7_9GAMM|nr:glycosyltransferase family 39 protein [Rehaibacterium terrae]MBB5015769.1 4-amino-4-deoxy-L-arabinose transferase-like glycosyltransferase [Rehaibacterium terrae]